jgi:single-stranded DNA-binding protein
MSAGDITVTITGNLTADPELRYTGVSRGFRITEEPFAANPRVAVPCGRV